MRIIITFVLAVVLHLLLGWPWTLLAGIIGGFWAVRRGWLVGLLGVGLGWLALMAYHYIVDARATRLMTEQVGGIVGNMPGVAIVALTLLIGLLLGALGGAIGTQARHLFEARRSVSVSH